MVMTKALAAIGLILSTPALILCVGGLLQSFFGISGFNQRIDFDLFIFRPALLMGGLLVGLALDVSAFVRPGYQDSR